MSSNRTLDETKTGIKRVNAVFENGLPDEIKDMDNVCNITNTGKIYSFVAGNTEDGFEDKLKALGASFTEIVELSLEDYFISLDLFEKKREVK